VAFSDELAVQIAKSERVISFLKNLPSGPGIFVPRHRSLSPLGSPIGVTIRQQNLLFLVHFCMRAPWLPPPTLDSLIPTVLALHNVFHRKGCIDRIRLCLLI